MKYIVNYWLFIACLFGVQAICAPEIVVLFSGKGACEELVSSTTDFLKTAGFDDEKAARLLKVYSWEAVDKEMQEHDEGILIVPGGSSWEYEWSLDKSSSKEKIVEKLQGDWSYLGICAGAYFALGSYSIVTATIINYKKMVVEPMKPLNLFPIKPYFSAFDTFNFEKDKVFSGVQITPLSAKFSKTSGAIFWNGGPAFDENSTAYETLVTYDDTKEGAKAAVIARQNPQGKGRIVLMGPHPEYISSPADLEKNGVMASEAKKMDVVKASAFAAELGKYLKGYFFGI